MGHTFSGNGPPHRHAQEARIMGLWDGIENESYTKRSKNIPVGNHVLTGKRFVVQASQKVRGITNFIAEFEVVSSDSPELSPGDSVSAIYGSDKASFLRKVKYLLANYMVACERQISADITLREVDAKIESGYIDAITDGDGTAYAGFQVRSIGRMTETKTGAAFIAHEWEPAA
jgi:hypothetical protein